MGKIDRAIRLSIALGLVGIYFSGIVSGTLGNLTLVFAGVMAATSMVSSCPLYRVLGINTAPKVKSI